MRIERAVELYSPPERIGQRILELLAYELAPLVAWITICLAIELGRSLERLNLLTRQMVAEIMAFMRLLGQVAAADNSGFWCWCTRTRDRKHAAQMVGGTSQMRSLFEHMRTCSVGQNNQGMPRARTVIRQVRQCPLQWQPSPIGLYCALIRYLRGGKRWRSRR